MTSGYANADHSRFQVAVQSRWQDFRSTGSGFGFCRLCLWDRTPCNQFIAKVLRLSLGVASLISRPSVPVGPAPDPPVTVQIMSDAVWRVRNVSSGDRMIHAIFGFEHDLPPFRPIREYIRKIVRAATNARSCSSRVPATHPFGQSRGGVKPPSSRQVSELDAKEAWL